MDIFLNTQIQNRQNLKRSLVTRFFHLLLFVILGILQINNGDLYKPFNQIVLILYWGHVVFDFFYLILRLLTYHGIFLTRCPVLKGVYSLFRCSINQLDICTTTTIILSRIAHLCLFIYSFVLFLDADVLSETKSQIKTTFIVYSIFSIMFYITFLGIYSVIIFNIWGICRLARIQPIVDSQRNIIIGYVDTITIRKQPVVLKINNISLEEFRRFDKCYICYDNMGNTFCNPCQHKDICFECASRLERCPQCRRTIEEMIIYELKE